MKNKRFFHSFTVLLAALVCLGGFSVTAYAGGGEDIPTDDSNVIVKTEPQPLTPEGNMELIDDIQGDASEDKQFIVVQSRGGNYFYIVIDKAAQGENTVHFLNQVDEADLLSIIEDENGAATTPAVCSCSDKCAAGNVNMTCALCSTNMTECAGKEAEPNKDTFSIYQLKRGDETWDLRFEPYDRLTATGHAVDPANYDLIYTAPLTRDMTLEQIYERFNIDHPADFKGHSLSVSDVVVLHQNGQNTAHYVDSIGYRQTPEFLQPQNYLKHVEDIVEQNDNNFDGIINNTPQTPTVGELEQKAKAGEPISLIDLANAIHADKERGKEEKPSIRAQLRAAKEQTAQRKAQRSKTQDLERS